MISPSSLALVANGDIAWLSSAMDVITAAISQLLSARARNALAPAASSPINRTLGNLPLILVSTLSQMFRHSRFCGSCTSRPNVQREAAVSRGSWHSLRSQFPTAIIQSDSRQAINRRKFLGVNIHQFDITACLCLYKHN